VTIQNLYLVLNGERGTLLLLNELETFLNLPAVEIACD
jgi:hypothetical protein